MSTGYSSFLKAPIWRRYATMRSMTVATVSWTMHVLPGQHDEGGVRHATRCTRSGAGLIQ